MPGEEWYLMVGACAFTAIAMYWAIKFCDDRWWTHFPKNRQDDDSEDPE